MNTQEQQDLDELEAILFRIEGTVLPVTSGFRIDTTDKAAWAGRKIIEAEDRIERQRAIANEYKRRIDEWFSRSTVSIGDIFPKNIGRSFPLFW